MQWLLGGDDTFERRGGRQIKEELNTATQITRARHASASSVAQEQRSDTSWQPHMLEGYRAKKQDM